MSKNKKLDVETQPGEETQETGEIQETGETRPGDETEAQETGETVKKYRVIAPAKGFRRAGRLWQGVTEISADELTVEQVRQIEAEPRLTIAEI